MRVRSLSGLLIHVTIIGATATTGSPAAINVPIVLLASSDLRPVVRYENAAENLRGKYGYSPHAAVHRRGGGESGGIETRASSVEVELIDQERDEVYLALISVGTPPQTTNVTLDTGSPDLWLADTSCYTCNTRMTPFDTAKSSTFKSATTNVTLHYGSGEVSGVLGSDVARLSGFNIADQPLVVVNDIGTNSNLIGGTSSGILGLGLSTQPHAQTSVTFWDSLVKTGQLSAKEMSFWFRRYANLTQVPEEKTGGIFTLGGRSSNLFTGDVEFLELASQNYWALKLSALQVNGSPLTLARPNALAVIDTGTSLIGGPSADVAAFWEAIPGSARASNLAGFYTFTCDSKLEVAFSFGGKSWPISADDLVLSRTEGGNCVGSIFDLALGSSVTPEEGRPEWIFGASFMKNVYTIFRAEPPSIGFAQLSAATLNPDLLKPSKTSSPKLEETNKPSSTVGLSLDLLSWTLALSLGAVVYCL